MCAMFGGTYEISRVPLIRDTFAVLEIFEYLGGEVHLNGNTVCLDSTNVRPLPIPRRLTVMSTGTFHYAGALLARFGKVEIAEPGGDEIGARPVDVHLELFQKLGCEVTRISDRFRIEKVRAPARRISMRIRSAGALINAVQVAYASRCDSIELHNVPVDADIEAALDFLRARGGTIDVRTAHNQCSVTVRARPRPLTQQRIELPADRNDAVTWLFAAGVARSCLSVHGVAAEELDPALAFLRQIGARVEVSSPTRVRVDCTDGLRAEGCHLILGPSPGFHSDWGPLAQAVLARAEGRSTVEDRMYERRYRHVPGLRRLGATVAERTRRVEPGSLMFDRSATEVTVLDIVGRPNLTGGKVVGHDVRGTASLALACAIARGPSLLSGVVQLDRGYERFAARLRQLGADVQQC